MFLYERYVRISTMDKETFPKVGKKYAKDYTFGWQFFLSLIKLFPYFYPKLEWAFIFTAIAMAFNGLSEFLTNHIGNIPGEMYFALSTKNSHKFWHIFVKGTLMYVAKCATLALVTFFSWLLYISFRRNLVNLMHKRYFKNRVYYRVNCLDGEGIDNPDQRLTQDIEKTCNVLANSIIPTATAGPFVVAYYTWKTWKTAGPFGVGLIYLYFVIGTIVNRFLIIPLTKWSARVEKCEGNFRYKHVTIRDNAESSILYSAENFENEECNRLFNILIKKQFSLVFWRLPANFWQQFFDYYGGLLSYALQFIPIIMFGTYDSQTPAELAQTISNNAFVYIYLVNSFTRLTDLAVNVGEMAGIFQRVADFIRYTEEIDKNETGFENKSFDESSPDLNSSRPAVIVETHSDGNDVLFEFKNVCYSLPNDKNHLLMNNLNLRSLRGQNLLISGPSGAGKSSFLRVLMRIWDINSGSITFGITSEHILHVSQRPYFPSGGLSLRQQIEFPIHLSQTGQTYRNTGLIEELMIKLKVHHLLSRCGGFDESVDFEWQETLTPGELQRLSFIRVIIHRPVLAILDEATNAVSVDAEKIMYDLLVENGINFISVGHRPSLQNYHSLELKLDGKTGYTLETLNI